MNTKGIKQTSIFFILSLLWSATIFVLPQVYLLKFFPDDKSFLLSVTLSLTTLGAALGIFYSQYQVRKGITASKVSTTLFGILSIASMLLILFEIPLLPLYLAATFIFRFTSNWLFNHIDIANLSTMAEGDKKGYVANLTIFQMLGQMCGPLLFGLTLDLFWVSFTIVLVMLVWTTYLVSQTHFEQIKLKAHETSEPWLTQFSNLSIHTKRYFLYTLLIMAGGYGFFGQLIYLLKDYKNVENAEFVSSIIVASALCLSIVSVFVLNARIKNPLKHRYIFVLPTLIMVSGSVLLIMSHSMVGYALLPLFLGLGTGMFFYITRLYAASPQDTEHTTTVLSLYNNMPNLASLVIFILLGVVAKLFDTTNESLGFTYVALFTSVFIAAGLLSVLSPFHIKKT